MGDQLRFTINSEECQSLLLKLGDRGNGQKLGAGFAYPFLFAKMQKPPKSTKSLSEKYSYLRVMASCAETALINKNISGCLETSLELLKGGIDLALLLKYRED